MKNKRESKSATCKACGVVMRFALPPYENHDKTIALMSNGFCSVCCENAHKGRTQKSKPKISETGYTPGPWERTGYGVFSGSILLADCKPDYGMGTPRTRTQEEAVANATLIAAAPEMWEALIFFRELYQSQFENMPLVFQTVDMLAELAINKAEGREGAV